MAKTGNFGLMLDICSSVDINGPFEMSKLVQEELSISTAHNADVL